MYLVRIFTGVVPRDRVKYRYSLHVGFWRNEHPRVNAYSTSYIIFGGYVCDLM